MLCAAAFAAGCSSGGETDEGASFSAVAEPGERGNISWALGARLERLDPLYAELPGEALVSRQIHEPLIAELSGPFDEERKAAGLALSAVPSADATVWRLRLRRGVRFQDASAFNASAVLANVERWLATTTGQELLPALLVDAPTPHLVRFILPAADPRFDQILAAPQLGIVSPRAIVAAAGGALAPGEVTDSGTGPFELRERSGERLLLAPNAAWWAAGRGLGPGIDQLEFVTVADAAERSAQLADGDVQVASDLGPVELSDIRGDPLLTVVPAGAGVAIALERSVRGIPPGLDAPSLNAVWRTALDSG